MSRATARATLLLQRLRTAAVEERRRLGCQSIGEATPLGARLVDPDTDAPATDDRIRQHLRQLHPVHGLFCPKPSSTMLLVDGRKVPVPSNHMIHPDTLRVLPIAGNVGYDADAGQLVVCVDCVTGLCTPIRIAVKSRPLHAL